MVQYAIIQFYRWKSGNIDVFSFALNRKLLQATSSNITNFFQNKKSPDMILEQNEDFHFLRDFFTNIWEISSKYLIFRQLFVLTLIYYLIIENSWDLFCSFIHGRLKKWKSFIFFNIISGDFLFWKNELC